MKNTKKFFSRLASLCLGMTIAVSMALPAMAAPSTPTLTTKAVITADKVLTVKDGKFPSMDTSYEFTLSKEKLFKLDGTAVTDLSTMPMPTSTTATASILASDPAIVNNSNAKTAPAVFGEMNFEGKATGVYVYKIVETAGTVPGVNYDITPRYAAVYVVNLVNSNGVIQYDTAGKVITTISQINIYKGLEMTFDKITADQTDKKVGTGTPDNDVCKASYIHDNTYYAAGLTVKAEIAGAGADTSKTYEYTLTLKDSKDNADKTNYSYTITKADGSTTKGTITDGGTFILGKDDKIVIDLPIGEKYTVTGPEIEDGYKATITGKAGQTDINVTGAVTAGEKSMFDPAVAGNGNVQTFTYTKGFTPPTGVMLDMLPYALVVVLAGAGLTFALRKRKTEQ